MHIFKKGDSDYQNELNLNFSEVATGIDGSVKKAGNETIAGIKSFKDGILVKGEDYGTVVRTMYNSSNATKIADGSIVLAKKNGIVFFSCSFSLASVWFKETNLGINLAYPGEDVVRLVKSSGGMIYYDPVRNGLIAGDDIQAGSWVTASGMWFAK